MARVYLALDTRLKRYVTVKTIARPLREDPDYIQRFGYEAQAIARLDHPHIVQVYRYGEADGLLYMIMKYVEGVSLAERLDAHRRAGTFMEPAEALRIIRELGQALDYAHEQGVIHRDVKPSNVMIDQQGRVILTDFGLSLLTDQKTQGEVFGTPHYMAPEQVLSSAAVVPQSDLYALGVILYQMFTNTLPFDGGNAAQVAELRIYQPPRPPRSIRPDIPVAVEAVILKALARHPEERYSSSAALTAALTQAAEATWILPAALPPTPANTFSERPTIVDRPPVIETVIEEEAADVPPLVYVQPAAVPEPPQRRSSRSCLALAIGLPLLLLLCGGGYWLLRGLGGNGGEIATLEIRTPDAAAVTPTAVATQVAGIEGTATTPPTLVVFPSPTSLPTVAVATATLATATVAPTPTQAPMAMATATSSPTATSFSTAVPTEVALSYRLLLVANGQESLFVVNQSDDLFPLEALQLGRGRGAVEGAEWEVESLAPGSCVTVWRDAGNPRPPNVECEQVGEQLERRGAERFWQRDFSVFYEDVEVTVCEGDGRCVVEIAP